MKNIKLPLLAFAASLLSLPAQDAATDPVGVVTIEVAAESDRKVGVPLLQTPSFTGTVSAIDNGLVTLSSEPEDVISNGHYLIVTSGLAEGSWSSVLAADSDELTLETPFPNLAEGDNVQIRPFWTLASLFSNGGTLPQSPDGREPRALVFTNDSSAIGVNLSAEAAYFYHDGSVIAEGWYSSGTFVPSDDVVISPETSITIRNTTDESISIPFVGDVSVSKFANNILSRSGGAQDNLIPNPYPSKLALGNSDLVENGVVRPSPDGRAPIDIVFIFDSDSTGYNPSAASAYFYHDGSVIEEGWYSSGTFVPSNTVEIPAGGAFIVRRNAGPDSLIEWNPETPYNL